MSEIVIPKGLRPNPEPERALSLIQPWAWMLFHGKPIENRFWHLWEPMAGKRVYIHASKGMTVRDYEDAKAFAAELGVEVPAKADLLRGGILGAVTVVNCLCPELRDVLTPAALTKAMNMSTENAVLQKSYLDSLGIRMPAKSPVPPISLTEKDLRWWMRGQHGFVLQHPEERSFVPCKGALGFWAIDKDLAATLGGTP